MKAVLRHEYMLAALLIAVSLIVVIPIPSHAAPLTQTQPITINAAGQATRITDNGLSGSATLTLKANAYNDSNHLLQIQNATGSLQIGSTNYTITNGHGNANKFGDIFLIGDTSPDNGQLFLHGTLKGNSLAFDSPASRLVLPSLTSAKRLNDHRYTLANRPRGNQCNIELNSIFYAT